MGKALVARLWLVVANVMASKRSKKENIRLPVPPRDSRTSALKLPSDKGYVPGCKKNIRKIEGVGTRRFLHMDRSKQ